MYRKPEEQELNNTVLPDEILVKMFSYLSTTYLLQNVSRVSKDFYKLTKETLSHRCVTLSDNAEKVSRFLTSNKSIVALNLMPRQKNVVIWKNIVISFSKDSFAKTGYCILNIESELSMNENSLILLLKNPKNINLKNLKIRNYHNIDAEETLSNWTYYASNLRHLELCCSYGEFQNEARSAKTSTLIKIGQASKKLEYMVSSQVKNISGSYLRQTRKP